MHSNIRRREFMLGTGLSAIFPTAHQRADGINFYHPADGYSVGDTWYLHRGGTTHLFYLQRRSKEIGSLGHATSTDLLHWTEQPVAVRPGAKGSYDESDIYTGCAYEHNGTIYLYYGSNRFVGERRDEGICLATSTDGTTFTKYPSNPVIRPNPKRYYSIDEPPPTFKHHAWPQVDCRDIAIVPDTTGGWFGYVVMRRKEVDAFHSACIALCRSKDLVHWTVGDPCCTPNRFNCMEVPDVFQIGNRWYMIALTADSYGQPIRWSDPNVRHATIVFSADRPDGPFTEVRDNFVIAGHNRPYGGGNAARTVEIGGERLMLYTRSEGEVGVVSWPVKLVSRPGGGLLPIYWNGIDRAFGRPTEVARVQLHSERGWAVRPVDSFRSSDRGCMISAEVTFRGAEAAALAVRYSGRGTAGPAYLAVLDAVNSEVSLVRAPDLLPIQLRRWPIDSGRITKLRVLEVAGMLDMYVDDVLVIQCYDKSFTEGGVALLARGGAARFTSIVHRSERP